VKNLEAIYPKNDVPIYPPETDQYLTNLPASDTLGVPAELGKRGLPAIEQLLQDNRDATRRIETSRHAIAWRAGVLAEFMHKHPDAFASLPAPIQTEINAWTDRSKRK